jgi:hypothetical protein
MSMYHEGQRELQDRYRGRAVADRLEQHRMHRTFTTPIGADAPEVTARFRDPAGNVIGLYQEPTKPARGKASVAD